MNRMKVPAAICAGVIIFGLAWSPSYGAFSFSAGDLAVLQVGLTGSITTLLSTGTAVQLDEFTTGGAAVPGSTIDLPVTASGSNNPFTLSGTAGSEGALSLSANGEYLVAGGYDVGVGGTTQGTSTIALIDPSGSVNTSTTTNQLSGNNTRSATSVDGTEVWVAGAAGIVAQATGSSSGNMISTRNIREVSAVPGSVSPSGLTQLFGSSNKSSLGISTVGSGTPTSGSASATVLSGMTSSNAPNSFGYFFANSGTMFVGDGTDGIQEWTLNNGTWSPVSTLAGSFTAITGSVSGNTATIYALTGTSSGWSADNSLDSVSFNLSTNTFGTLSTLATATGDTGFSGVAFAPQAVPEPGSLSILGLSALALMRRRRRT
jgi:hypothetical protein